MAQFTEDERIWAVRGAATQVLDCEASEGLFGTSKGLSEALKSVASSQLWTFVGLSPIPSLSDESCSQQDSSEINCEEKRLEEMEDCSELEESYVATFESEYVSSSVPLYQEYWMNSMRKDLNRAQQTGIPDLVSAIRLPGLKTPPSLCPSSVLSPPGPKAKPYALWQELPEVKRILKSVSAHEIQLQEAMFELIVSEASYQKSLRIALNVFQCSGELKEILSRVQHHVLFSNLKDVCRVSEPFLQDLESHLREDVVMSQVGDILLNHQKSFRQAYVPYITNMMYQEALITELMEGNKKFALILKKLEKNPQCQRQTLKSFLILPFQRITRMTLLLENIVKRTKGVFLDVPNLMEAIEAVRKIVEECDRNVQQMKRTELLVFLDKLVDFRNVKAIPLITRGRHLVLEGALKQLIIGGGQKDVYIHLFNDLLLLSVKSGNRFVVQDHALFPDDVCVEDIKTVIFGPPSENFMLLLTNKHTRSSSTIILAARTRLEKETWIEVMSSK